MVQPWNYPQKAYHIGQNRLKIYVENSVSAIQHMESRNLIANPFAYSCSFTLHTSYQNGMFGQRGRGGCQNAQTIVIKAH